MFAHGATAIPSSVPEFVCVFVVCMRESQWQSLEFAECSCDIDPFWIKPSLFGLCGAGRRRAPALAHKALRGAAAMALVPTAVGPGVLAAGDELLALLGPVLEGEVRQALDLVTVGFKWFLLFAKVYAFLFTVPLLIRQVAPLASGFAGRGTLGWWWHVVTTGAKAAYWHFREPFPGAWAQDPHPNEPGGAVANWGVLTLEVLEVARTHPQGDLIRRLARRWHVLGQRLQAFGWAVQFRGLFTNATARRRWRPALLRLWPGDTRARPDLSPWFDWPCNHPGTIRWVPPV